MSQAFTQQEIDRALRLADTAGIFGPLPGVTFLPFRNSASQVTLRPLRRRGPMGPKLTVAAVWLFAVAGILALRYWPTHKSAIVIEGVYNPKFQTRR